MATYTADAVSLLAYLVDALPRHADQVFAEAEAGETVIQAQVRHLQKSCIRAPEIQTFEASHSPDHQTMLDKR